MKDLKHLYEFEKLLESANNALVQQACAEGKHALAYTCYHMPEVLLNTGNCFSVRLRAPLTGSLDISSYYMSNFICDYCKSLLERGIEGGYNFLSGLMGTETCSEMNRALEHFELLRLVDNEQFFVTFLDMPFKVTENTVRHYVDQLRRKVLTPLQEVYGMDVSDDALRMARAQYDRIVKKATDLLRISFVADEHFHPGNKLSKKIVLFDELVPGQIMAGFPNLIYLPAQVLPVFLCSILNQQITPPYLDAAENFGIPADVCPLPSAEAGCALRDEYPKLGTCFVACNMPCDGSVATTLYQDRYFNLPTYYYGVPIRYNEDAVQDYAVEELRGLIRFIEEQTGETFDWDAFFKAMKVYNRETEYELQKWEVNRTPYPQMTGETFWIYRMFFYHLSGGMDPRFLDTDRRVNRIMMRGYRQKKPCAPAMRHRCVEWSCPANFYPDFSVWAENCWGINVVASMESLISDIIINTEDPDQALADLARSYQRTTMRKHTKGGYANVLDELWVVCKQYNADMVLMYDQISCKGMDGLRGVFEEQAAARGVHMLWVAQDLLDSRTISKRDMRRQVNLYMQTVMGEEPVRPDLVDFDDALTW